MAGQKWCFSAAINPTRITCGRVARVLFGSLVLYVAFFVSFEEVDTSIQSKSLKNQPFIEQITNDDVDVEIVSSSDALQDLFVDKDSKSAMNATNATNASALSPPTPRNGIATFLSSDASGPSLSETLLPESGPPTRAVGIEAALTSSVGPKALARQNSTTVPLATILPTTMKQNIRLPSTVVVPSSMRPTHNATNKTLMPTSIEYPSSRILDTAWSSHPRTQFTDHILDIIFNLDLDRPKTNTRCTLHYTLTVQKPYSVPNITCDYAETGNYIWGGTLRRIFASKVLPYNLTFVGIHLGDFMDSKIVAQKACLGNSAEWGKYCIPNMEEVGDMQKTESNHDNPELYQSKYYRKSNKSWEERSSMPIFRGTARSNAKPEVSLYLCDNATVDFDTLMQGFPTRFVAVDFSIDNPDLLDARFSGIDGIFSTCMKHNATNGLSKLIALDRMDPVDYFKDRQVALVLSGIGAAFRMSTHFMYCTAVVLQAYKYVEWYTPYLEPYVHYIPLSEDLHDLKEVLLWVKSHPKKVKQIAENGRAFYEKYLTFYKHEEHIYELLYRLSEYSQFRGTLKCIDRDSMDPMNMLLQHGDIWERGGSKGNVTLKKDELKNSNVNAVASWSDHPRTQFTDHVLDIVFNLDLKKPKIMDQPCSQYFDLIVHKPYSLPNITLNDPEANDNLWGGTLRRIFASKVLPYNLSSLGFYLGDYMDSEMVTQKTCLGNAAEWGKYCVPNMEELSDMQKSESNQDNPERYPSKDYRKSNKSWDERSSIPGFRGIAQSQTHPYHCDDATVDIDTLLQAFPNIFLAVAFSIDHPDLLDARFTGVDQSFDTCMTYNATNGLSKLIALDRMDPVDYFKDRQVALVLSGIGAAFRMSTHFMYCTAVVLQAYKYVEWYTPYLEPYVHYIPLSEDLHDLKEVLLWVKSHPKKVKQIAENGRAFYEKYLTFYKHEEHIYELLYRLSEYTQFRIDQGLVSDK